MKVIEGFSGTVEFALVKLARPQIHVVWKDTNNIEGVTVKLTKEAEHNFGQSDANGLARLAPDARGLLPEDYRVDLVFDDKVYAREKNPQPVKLAEGFDGAVKVSLIKLARPQIQVVWKDTNNIQDVEVKLKKDGETVDFGKTGADGIAKLKSDAKGLLPGDYAAELVFDKKIYDREKSPAALKVTEGSDGVLKVALIKLARPKFKIVDNTTGKEVQGVGLKLTLSGASSPNYDLGESRPSGIVELADVPGILPGKYDIKLAADRFGPTLNSPADVTLDEASTATTEVKVTASKGAVIVDISRYDGQKLAAHVAFKLTGSVTKNETTEEATFKIEKEKTGDKTREVTAVKETKEIKGLAPGDYVIEIQSLKTNVLEKQKGGEVWRIGPGSDGKLKVKVEAGKTAVASFSLYKYEKVQLIGFNVQPGVVDGYRCSKCASLSVTAGACTTSLHGSRHPFFCKKCGYSASSAGDCAKSPTACGNTPAYVCVTCNTAYSDAGFCDTHNTVLKRPYCLKCNKWRDYKCENHGVVTTFHCATCSGFLTVACSHADCRPACQPCGKYVFDGADCATCKQTLEAVKVYKGLPDSGNDWKSRCVMMRKAIETALGSSDIKDSILKVFMAPEFYFRGREGAYPVGDLTLIMEQMWAETKDRNYKDWLFVYGTAIGYLKHGESGAKTNYTLTLSKVVSSGSPATIQVSHGTSGKQKATTKVCEKIPAANATLHGSCQWKLKQDSTELVINTRKPVTTSPGTYELELAGAGNTFAEGKACDLLEPIATEVFNVALVQRGGPDEGVATLRELVVYKEAVSPIDYRRNFKNVDWDDKSGAARTVDIHDEARVVLPTVGSGDILGAEPRPISAPGVTELNKTGLGGGIVFTMDGITFGLEVCLDHAWNRLANFYKLPPLAGTPKVQVHLIPSWGMSIEEGERCGVLNTLIFNVEGQGDSVAGKLTNASTGAWSKLTSTITKLDPPDNCTGDVKIYDPQAKTSTTTSHTAKLIELFQHKTGDGSSVKHYGDITVYTPEDLPEAETV